MVTPVYLAAVKSYFAGKGKYLAHHGQNEIYSVFDGHEWHLINVHPDGSFYFYDGEDWKEEHEDILLSSERYLDPSEIKQGDLVDFGLYGCHYVCDTHLTDSGNIRVTSQESDRFSPSSNGWYIDPTLAKEIIEKADS